MAQFVDAVPLVRPGALRLVNPRTRAGIRALHAAGEPPLPTYL
jgi:hypothetical protein